MKKKYKILMLSDHALSTSGVGTQSRHLINGLLKKEQWTVRQFGAALKHDNYDTIQINEDFVIKPIDGFGSKELLRLALATEKPDILFIFTDPRFFIWLFEMEDEIHQICPIVWWHVWDNKPFPIFNDPLYKSTDLINCHSYLTYEMCKEHYPQKTNFVPHALPEYVFFPLPKDDIKKLKIDALGEDKKDDFVVFWMNRNARRKRSGDLIYAWSEFINQLKRDGEEKPKATLLMHTDPLDAEGPNLFQIADHLGMGDYVIFSQERVDFNVVNILHNISDVCINVSYAEGFGLGTLEAMQTGTPIIAPKTGGLTRQVVDHRDGTENGVALDIDIRTLVGSQQVPFIWEDYASNEKITEALLKMYYMPKKEKEVLSEKVKKYVAEEFSYQKTVDLWHDTMVDTIENWRSRYERYQIFTF